MENIVMTFHIGGGETGEKGDSDKKGTRARQACHYSIYHFLHYSCTLQSFLHPLVLYLPMDGLTSRSPAVKNLITGMLPGAGRPG